MKKTYHDHPFNELQNFPPDIYRSLSPLHRSIFFKAVRNLKYYHVRFYYNIDNDPIAHVLYNLKRNPKQKLINLKEKTT